MTARPPVETVEASSDGSSESLDKAGETLLGTKLDHAEPSMSKTLEAILSKSDSDGDDDPVVPVSGVGTKTLMGIGAFGLPLPPRAKSGEAGLDDHPVMVDDMFDSHEPDSQKASGEDEKVGDLLDEVAEALNVQAAESRDRVMGALPGTAAPTDRRGGEPDVSSMPTDDEFEFEDPDDGPTTLNLGGAADGEDVDLGGGDDEEEAVVLGPAKLPGARPIPIPAPSLARAAHPVPGGGQSSGLASKRATPFAGLPAATLPTFPAPTSGRARLPTPAPGRAAASIPAPAGTRSGLPHGTPVDGVPQASSQGDSSRRSAARATSGASEKLRGASAAVRTTLTSAMESASVVLKKDVKFRVASFGGVVVATLVVGILIGRAVLGSGKVTTAVAEGSAETPAAKVAKSDVEAAKPASAAVAQPPARTEVANAAAVPVAAPVGGQPAPDVPVVAPTAEAVPGAAAPMAFDPQTIHKRRARRATLVAKEDSAAKLGPPKPAVRPTVIATSPKGTKAPAAAPAKAGIGKKPKSTWHDPFAD